MLATLIEAYEDEHYPMSEVDAIEAIKFRMEQQGLTRKDLEPLIGSRTRVAEVLNRKRNQSIAMIRRLNSELGIPAEVLLRPTQAGQRPAEKDAAGLGPQGAARRCQAGYAAGNNGMRPSGSDTYATK